MCASSAVHFPLAAFSGFVLLMSVFAFAAACLRACDCENDYQGSFSEVEVSFTPSRYTPVSNLLHLGIFACFCARSTCQDDAGASFCMPQSDFRLHIKECRPWLTKFHCITSDGDSIGVKLHEEAFSDVYRSTASPIDEVSS